MPRLVFAFLAATSLCAPAPQSSSRPSPSGDTALREFYGRALEGRARAALQELARVPEPSFSAKGLTQARCVLDTYDANKRVPIRLGDSFVDAVAQAYRDYWLRGLLEQSTAPDSEAQLYAQLRAAFATVASSMPPTLDAATEALGPLLEAHGFHSLRGVTAPFYDLMLWRTQTEQSHAIALPEQKVTVKVVLLRDFVLFGWSGFATCGAAHTGGWAKDDALYCVADAYDLNSEDYEVSYLAHEGQHFADYQRFPRLEQPELEYRAKLVELSLAVTTAPHLLQAFASDAGTSREAPHAFANGRVSQLMSKRVLGSDTLVADPARWAAVAIDSIRQTAFAALEQSSAELAKTQLQVQWRQLDIVPYKGKQDDIFFVTPALGFYGNGAGKIYKTIDGGAHWREVWNHPGTYVRALGFLDAKHGFAGNIGTDYFPGVTDTTPLYETRDGGDTWHAVKIGGAKVKGLCAIDVLQVPAIDAGALSDKVVLHAAGRVGGPTVLVTSLDEGKTWTATDMSAYAGMILDVKFLDRNTGFVCAGSSAEVEQSHALILKTVDGGKTWAKKYESTRPFEDAWKCAFPSRNVGYATVQSYDEKAPQRYVAKTIDGGETWKELALVEDAKLREFGIGFVDDAIGWVGAAPHGFQTKDGGESWTAIDFGNAVNKIRVLRTGTSVTGYAIGTQVYKFESQ